MTATGPAPAEPPAPEGPPRADRPIAIRFLVAPSILLVVCAVLYLHHATGNPLGTDLLLSILGVGAGIEMAALLAHRVPTISRWHAGLFCGLLCLVGVVAPSGEAGDVLLRAQLRVVVLMAGLVSLLLLYLLDTRGESIDRIGGGLVPLLYVGLLLSVMRELGVGEEGAARLLFVVLVAKASDIGGYLVGKPFGRHKMVPHVSPGKSWEGTAGGLALSVGVALLAPGILELGEAAWSVRHRIAFGLGIGAASILAGVTQSGWKRRVGAKHSSTLIPEMGGLLDQLDSLLLAAPTAWLWYHLVGL